MDFKNSPLRAYVHLEPENQSWIDARSAWILEQFGSEQIRNCEITLPNGALLRQYRDGTDEEVIQFFGCVAQAMGLDAERIDFVLGRDLTSDDGSRALGLYQANADRFTIWIDESQLGDPPELLATLVHELCHVQLMGYGRMSGSEPDNEPLTDLLGVYFGYGIIMANSVVYDQTLRMGHFYENQIGRRGYLTMSMFGYALALLARLRGENGAEWKRHMRPDVRDAFTKTQRFFECHGLPDLSVVPTSFNAPRITVVPSDEPVDAPKRNSSFYPDDCEVEVPDDQTDFAIDSEPSGPDCESETTCIYCQAVVDSNEEDPICRACQESIDEGERELNELREIDDYTERLLGPLFIGTVVFVAAFVGLMFLLSRLLDL